MSVEAGQIWRHGGKSGLTVWEIMSTFLASDGVPTCEMMLLVSSVDEIHISRANSIVAGETRDYPLNLFEDKTGGFDYEVALWQQVEAEDIPLLLLAELP